MQNHNAIFLKKPNFDNEIKNVTSDKNELNELSKKVKALSTKGFTKDLINEVSRSKIEQKDFLQEYFIIEQKEQKDFLQEYFIIT